MEKSIYPESSAPLISFQSEDTPYQELDLLSDNEYMKGFLNTPDNADTSLAVSMTSASTEFSYAQPQGIRDSVFKPIREVLADHHERVDTHSPGRDSSSEHIQSEAMVQALKALQSKIARLETERAAAAEKFEALSSRTSQKQLEFIDSPIRHQTQSSPPHPPYPEPISVSELRSSSLQDFRQTQTLGFDRLEVERRIDSINDKCWRQSEELEVTRDMLRRAELERQHTEEHMQRLERKYDELRVSSSQALAAPLQADASLLARRASEEAVRRVEQRQLEMASSQHRTEERVKELQHELKLERHRRKLLQEKAAELQASQDSNLTIARAASIPSNPSQPHIRMRPKKKRAVANKLSKHSRALSTERDGHYRVQLKDIPFVVGTSTSQSYSVGANYQQLFSLLKSHNSTVCGRRGARQVTGKGTHGRGVKSDMFKDDSVLLIEELERELAGLQIQHQHLARELQMSQEEPTHDSEPIEHELRELLHNMDVKAQHVRLAKTINKQVTSRARRSPDPPSSMCHSDTSTTTTSPPVNLYSNAPLPASNITALRAIRNIQSTLKEEDLRWN